MTDIFHVFLMEVFMLYFTRINMHTNCHILILLRDKETQLSHNREYNDSIGMLLDKVEERFTRVSPKKVSGLAACSENCKWYSSLPLGAVLSLFCESV
jgi:hypothetical protein